jgi:hypothetical protein
VSVCAPDCNARNNETAMIKDRIIFKSKMSRKVNEKEINVITVQINLKDYLKYL